MKKIRIEGIECYYYVEDDGDTKYYLIYCYEEYDNNSKQLKEHGECDVSDLCDLTIYQYNELVDELNKHYPDYPIEHLEGRFI